MFDCHYDLLSHILIKKDDKEYLKRYCQKVYKEDNIKYIFGIEGLDYLENIDDIDILYFLGLRSVNPVWNNKNKFGGGVRASKECGLTQLGKQLIKN